MVDFMNWMLLFFKDAIAMLISLRSIDGFSLGHMLLGVAITGTVVSATIGAVAIASRMIKDNSYAESTRRRMEAYHAGKRRKKGG